MASELNDAASALLALSTRDRETTHDDAPANKRARTNVDEQRDAEDNEDISCKKVGRIFVRDNKEPRSALKHVARHFPFAMYAAVVPWSCMSITTPMFEGGVLVGLLLDIAEFIHLLVKISRSTARHVDSESVQEKVLRLFESKLGTTTVPLRRWSAVSDPKRIVVVLEKEHFDHIRVFPTSKETCRLFDVAGNTFASKLSFTDLGRLDRSAVVDLRPEEQAIHPLVLSMYRRYACRTTVMVTWEQIPAELYPASKGMEMEAMKKIPTRLMWIDKKQIARFIEQHAEEFERVARRPYYFMPVRL